MGGFNVGAAGAFARGLGSGIDNFQQDQERQQMMAERKQRMSLADVQNQRQTRLLEQQDTERQLMTEAQRAAMQPLEAERKAFEEAATKTGADPSAYQPSKQALLRAGQAQADFFYTKGRLDLGEQAWKKTEEMRAMMRAPAAQKLLAKVIGGGDITKELVAFDENMDDGLDLQKVEEFKGPNGERAYKVWQRRRFDGKGIGEPNIVTAQELLQRATMAVQDPKGAAELTRKSYLENLDAANRIKEAEAKARATRDEEDHKQANRLWLDYERTANDIKVEKERTAGRIAAKTTVGSGDVAAERQALTQERIAADKNVDQILTQMKEARASEKPGLQKELTDAKRHAAEIRDKLARFGEGKRGTSLAETPGAPTGLPPGAKQIGTSGGKPVWQTPDGRKFIQD